MSENNYIERGKTTINSNIDRARIAWPNDETVRKVSLVVTQGGHLVGRIQPADNNPQEKIALKQKNAQIRNRTFMPEAMPDYARLVYREVPSQATGELRQVAEFVYDDITMADGSPLRMEPNTVFLFNHLEQLPKDMEQGERSAFSGYAVDLNGNLTTPATWRRMSGDEMFFSGDNMPFDRERYLEAKANGKAGASMVSEDVPGMYL